MSYKNLRPLYDRLFVKPIKANTGGLQLTKDTEPAVRDWRIVAVGCSCEKEFKEGQKVRTPSYKCLPLPFDETTFMLEQDNVLYIDNEDGTFTLPNAEIIVDYDKPKESIGGLAITRNMAQEHNKMFTATIKFIGTKTNKEGEGYEVGKKILCDLKTGTPLMLGGDRSEWYSVRGSINVLAVFDADEVQK